MRKKALSWLLTVSMVLSLFVSMPITAAAVDTAAGNAAVFDSSGNSQIRVSDSDSLDVVNALTVEAWIKPSSGGGEWALIMGKQWNSDDANPWYSYRLLAASANSGEKGFPRKVAFQIAPEGSEETGVESTSIIQNDVWTHIAGVYDGSSVKIYINGVLENSNPVTGSIRTSSLPLFLGKAPWTNYNNYNGMMDEVRVWNVARTAEQISSDMQYILAGDEPGLVGYWNFNEEPGATTIADASGNNNTGTMRNSASLALSAAPVSTPSPSSWIDYASESFAGGDGLTEDTAFEIVTAGQLAYLASCTISDPNYANGKYFVLTGDINLSAHEWVPITMFRGSLDGQDHKITALTIDAAADYQGLIAQAGAGAILKNLTVENCDIIGGRFVGALFGSYEAPGTLTVENCHSSGTVTATDYVGGLFGDVQGTSGGAARTITNCSSSCTVSSTIAVGNHSFAGGLMGRSIGSSITAEAGNIISRCFATGAVSGQSALGGLVGYSANSSVINCYATGDITGNLTGLDDGKGGLIGFGSNIAVTNCYAAGLVSANTGFSGGAIGSMDAAVSLCQNSYYNSLNSKGTYGTSMTLSDMQHPDFVDTLNATQSPLPWTTDSGSMNGGFPVLKWQNPSSAYDGEFDIEADTGTGTGWSFAEQTLTITQDGSYRIYGTGTETARNIVVNTGLEISVTLDNVNAALFHPQGTAKVTMILKDGTTNTFNGSADCAAVRAASGATLTIQGEAAGTGELIANGGSGGMLGFGAAGIGGNHNEGAGTIVINGGIISATGGSDNSGPGAGIGGGGASKTTLSGGTIAIHGGTVTASGGYELGYGSLHAPGIGGYDTTSLTIDGGDVTAYGGHYAINASSLAIGDEATVRAFSANANLNSPAIMGHAAPSGNTAYLLSFSLDTAVLVETDVTITQKGSAAETFTLTIPGGYRNFTTTVETANLYTAALPDGTQKVTAVSDGSTEFAGSCPPANSAFSSYAVKLEAVPPYASGVSISGTPTIGQTLTGNYTYNAGGSGAEMFTPFRWLRAEAEATCYNSFNATLVENGPGSPAGFTLTEATLISKLWTYHYVSPAATPGTIRLTDGSGNTYGPWAASHVPGTSGWYWEVSPNLVLQPGTYTVVDSDNATWSYNTDSGNAGFIRVFSRAYTPIEGAVSRTYTLTEADESKWILFEVTPWAASSHGPAVLSAPVGAVAAIPVIDAPILQSAEVRSPGTQVALTFDKDMSDPAGIQGQFSVSADDVSNPVTAVSSGSLAKVILLTLTTPVTPGQSVKVSYTPGTVTSADGGVLASFANQSVTNNVPAAMIGSTEYTSLAGALAAAAGADTIVLISDITYSNAIKADSKNVTIDLNGFDLTVSGAAEHALQATKGCTLTITDKDDDGGSLTVHSSGSNKYALFADSNSHIIIAGTVSAVYSGGDNQGIIGAFAMGVNATIQVTGSVAGYTAGIYAINDAKISVTGDVSGGYDGAYAAYEGSVDVTGNLSGSRALVAEYSGIAAVQGNITGGATGIYTNNINGWVSPHVTVTGDVASTSGTAIDAGWAGDIEITGNITGPVSVSGTDTSCPEVTVNGDITVSSGFGVSVFYGGMVTVNGRILGASPYLKLDNLNIAQGDYNEISGDYYKYTNQTVNTPTPFAANTVYVTIPVTHTVTIGTLSGGTIMANPTSAVPGTTINLTITPASGKQLKVGTLKYNDGSDHAITGTSFTMPGSAVTVTAQFEDVPVNQAPVITSSWNYTTVYFGKDYAYTITVTDAENTSDTKIYSSLDGAPDSIAWTYPGAPGMLNMTLSPVKGVLVAGSHTLRYYAQDAGGAVSSTLTLTFTVTTEPANTGGGGGGVASDTGAKITVATTDGSASVTGTLTETNGGTRVVIKNDAFDKVDAADKPVSISAQLATVTFDKKAMDTIGAASGSGDVTLTVRQVPASELSAAQKALVGSRPVYDFKVTGGGKTISSFNGGHATVNIPYTLGAGENPHAIVIWYLSDSGKLVGIRGHYDAATKTVTFMTPHFSRFVIGYNPVNFKDVASSAWYLDAVTFIAARDITTGTGNDNYSPDAKLTRCEFIVLLMRAYGIDPDANPTDNFSDAGNTYYTGYLAAAKRLGISAGVGNNQFAPDKEITRQEMFTLLYNALKVIGEMPASASSKTLADFSDAPDIASWAKDAMALLVEAGTIAGSGGKLNPAGTATRAEMAQVLYNLLVK